MAAAICAAGKARGSALAVRRAGRACGGRRNNLVHHPYEENRRQRVRNSAQPEIGRYECSEVFFGKADGLELDLNRYLNRGGRHPNDNLKYDCDPDAPEGNRSRAISQ